MKLGFNQATASKCKDHTMMTDLEACEKYGFDYVDIRCDVLEEYLNEHTAKELADWFLGHHLKPGSYSALLNCNWRKTSEEKKALVDEVNNLLPTLKTIGIKTVCCVPSFNITGEPTVQEIIDDTAESLNVIANLAEPFGIDLSLEPIGSFTCSVSRWDVAVRIIEKVNRDNVGLAFDYFHFYATGSNIKDLKNCDGRKINNFHLNDCEDLPVGAPYFTDAKRLWPGDGCINNKEIAKAFEKCGFNPKKVTPSIEIFRPEYYDMTTDENIRISYEKTKKFTKKFLDF